MKTKQTFFTILILVVVSSILTMAFKSRYYLMNLGGIMPIRDSYQYNNHDSAGSFAKPIMGEQGIVADSASRMGYIPPYDNYNNKALQVDDRVYRKSSFHSVVANDVSAYLRNIKEYVLSIDGRVLSSSVSSNKNFNNGYLYVKVPVNKFDEATSRITENVDKVISESIDSSDITGELVNKTDRLQALKDDKSLQEAYLKDAKTAVEKRRHQLKIDNLSKQIVAAQKNIDSVDQKVKYATLSISVADNERYFNSDAGLNVHDEFLRAWNSLKVVLKVGAYFGIWIVVYSVIWLPIVWIIKKLIEKLKKK